MGRASREKGKRGERQCRDELAEVFRCAARRGVQYQGGADSPDVVLSGVPVHVEAKRTERLLLWAAVDQAKAEAGAGETPIVWHKPNRRDSVVIVETSRLYDLAVAIVDARRKADDAPPAGQ